MGTTESHASGDRVRPSVEGRVEEGGIHLPSGSGSSKVDGLKKKEREAEDILLNESYSPGGFKPTMGKASAAVSMGSIAYRYPTTS